MGLEWVLGQVGCLNREEGKVSGSGQQEFHMGLKSHQDREPGSWASSDTQTNQGSGGFLPSDESFGNLSSEKITEPQRLAQSRVQVI